MRKFSIFLLLSCLFGSLLSLGNVPADREPSLIFIIDFNDFMCFFCLDSFVNFCHSIPSRYRHEMVIGILTFDQTESAERKGERLSILKKKLRGFVSANQIEFPIIMDKSGVFKGLADFGTSVLVIDPGSHNIRRYVFPLSPNQQEEILSYFTRD